MKEKRLKSLNIVLDDSLIFGEISIENGKIASISKTGDFKDDCPILIPSFIDTHIHGYGGYGTDDGDALSIVKMSSALLESGSLSYFPTIYTNPLDKMIKDIKAVVEANREGLGASILGIHIEGPFISEKRKGAQSRSGILAPSIESFNALYKASEGLLKAMTIAPEIENIESVIKEAEKNGIALLQGHTDADYRTSIDKIELGANGATHLFNAMTQMTQRAPGVVGAFLERRDTTAEIILDGKHVHKAVAKAAINAKGVDSIIGITDSLSPTGKKEGPFFANGREVTERDGLWVTKGNESLIQGSSLTLLKAFQNLISWGYSLVESVKMTSSNAARRYSLTGRGYIREGYIADLLVLKKNLSIDSIYQNGEEKNVV